jgi:hypothetical protein
VWSKKIKAPEYQDPSAHSRRQFAQNSSNSLRKYGAEYAGCGNQYDCIYREPAVPVNGRGSAPLMVAQGVSRRPAQCSNEVLQKKKTSRSSAHDHSREGSRAGA